MVAAEMDDQKSHELQHFFNNIVDFVIKTDPKQVTSYVDKLRAQNPGITDDALARKIMSRQALKNGFIGAIAGVGGLITLPVTIPAALAATWRMQAVMAVAISYVYGHNLDTTDLKTDIYIIIAGDSAKEALKRFGIEITKAVTKKTIDKYVTREVMMKIWAVIGQKIVTIAGEKSLTSLVKMVPLVGAPVGFVFDWTATRTVGEFAIKYYSGKG